MKIKNLQPTLENDLVLVRPVIIEDFENLYKVAQDPLIWELHQNPDRYQLPVFKQFFKDAINSKGNHLHTPVKTGLTFVLYKTDFA